MEEAKSYKMDLSELTKIVFERIQKLHPVNVSKIMGFILLKEPSEQEMVTLAFGPENVLLSKIDDAKTILGFLSPTIPAISSHNQSVLNPLPAPSVQNFSFVPRTYPHSIREDQSLCNQAQFSHSKEKMDPSSSMGNNKYYQDASFNGGLSSRTSKRSANLPEFPINACHYFYKGYCKHGANCRYYHGQSSSDGSSQALCSNFNGLQSEERIPSCIEKLENEIIDLLKCHRGLPISISMLPMLYYERYGRILQADRYLIESQQHGKAGFSLTRLLAFLKNTICLIDKPHGQLSIILAKDAPRYVECQHERSEPVASSSSSHHIYITFQADSAFNEEDVFDYFKQFGPVNDVRLSSQEKRTYGFVSFLHPESVSELLMIRNPHYICGSRVLVKPYKEKTRVVDRPYVGNNKLPLPYPHQYIDLDSEPLGIPRKTDSSRIVKSNIEEQVKMRELERSRLARSNLVQEPLDQQPSSCGVEDSKLLGDAKYFSLEDRLGSMLVVLNNELSDDVRTRNTSNNYSDKESGHIELPDNPFAFSPSGGSSL